MCISGRFPHHTGKQVARTRVRELKEGNGAESRTRTDDLLITNQLLYQLSYFGLPLRLYRCAA